MNEDIESKIFGMITTVMGLDASKLDRTKKINTISNWDSFNNLMLVAKFQEELGIEFTAMDIERIQTLNDLLAFVGSKMRPANG